MERGWPRYSLRRLSRFLFPSALGMNRAMVLAPPPAEMPSGSSAENRGPCDKVRIRFSKSGHLRLVSHHDLLRCFERMLRRADLPFRSTKGFNPHPRLVFALSLPLGVVGREEVVELELDQTLPTEEIHHRLAHQAPPGLEILSVRRIDPKITAQVTSFCYRLPLPAERRAAVQEKATALLATSECWVERTRPERRRVNVRPFVKELRVGAGFVDMDLWMTPGGTARPDEVAGLLGVRDLLDAGAVLERCRLELNDETPPTHAKGIA
jgi:radical SAM-linked protein